MDELKCHHLERCPYCISKYNSADARLRELESKLCMAMELLRVVARTDWRRGDENDYTHAKAKFLDEFVALSSSSPCPHAEEVKRLRELEKIAERAGDVEKLADMLYQMIGDGEPSEGIAAALSRWLKGE